MRPIEELLENKVLLISESHHFPIPICIFYLYFFIVILYLFFEKPIFVPFSLAFFLAFRQMAKAASVSSPGGATTIQFASRTNPPAGDFSVK